MAVPRIARTPVTGAPPSLALLVLGPLAVGASGELRAVRGQQGQILSTLAAHWPHPVPVDTLVDELWPEHPPASARTGFRVVLTRLRGRLPPAVPAIVHEGGSYRLDVPAEQFDLARFEQLVARAARDMAAAPGAAAEQLITALGLWRGDAFAPFAGSPRLGAAAIRAEERRRAAEELLVSALLDAGRADSAATWASGLVEAEPYRERRWEQLMLALYRTGRQAEALQAGRRATVILREELGLDPGPALRTLEADILAQAGHLDDVQPAAGALTTGTAGEDVAVDQVRAERMAASRFHRARLPVWTTSLIGRDEDLSRLATVIDQTRWVTVVGPPGVGKTRLAAEFAASTVRGTTLWLDLVDVEPIGLTRALADLTGARLTGDDPVAELAAALPGEAMLLVLDNCEHLVDPIAQLTGALLAACPRLTVLSTSRRPVGSPAEAQYRLEPLPHDDALRLLLERAPAGLSAEPARGALERLVTRLDGLPLSIELIAPTLGQSTVGHVLEQLDHAIPPDTGRGQRDRRHRSLDMALDWSLRLLGEQDRQLFAVLGAVAGPFTTADVADLVRRDPGEVGTCLGRLAAHGLLRVSATGHQPRWAQPHLLRLHARSVLAADGTLEGFDERQAMRHVTLARCLATDLAGPDEDRAVARLDRIAPQLDATHRWLVQRGRVDEAVTYNLALWEYTFFRQDYGRYQWLEDCLAMAGAGESARVAELAAEGALAAWARDRFLPALALADRAEAAALAAGRPLPLAALKARFNVAAYEGRTEDAVGLLGRLLQESEGLADDRHHADNLVVLALGMAQWGRREEAAAAASQGMAVARATGNPSSVAWAGVALGSVELPTEPDRAARAFTAASRLARTVRNRWVDGMALSGLVTALRRQGRTDQARRLLAEVVRMWGRNRSHGQLVRAAREAALLAVDDGAAGTAARLLALSGDVGIGHPMLPDDLARLADVAAAHPDGSVEAPATARLDQLILAELAEPAGGNSRPASGREPAPRRPAG
ncbi:BTAD domain-containing putative transcriptional regulator [Actinoplanes sp. GCM10030250]|uniref:AfsR/SARP family transcriptional regulator n=1 Tax=Actinoplanes sp. GCM10030250 TaxID=3273376 RepID=UPI0036175663